MKLYIFISVCFCVLCGSFLSPNIIYLEQLGNGEYCFYSTQNISSPLITRCDYTGFSYIYHCNSASAPKLRSLFQKIDGESIVLHDKDTNQIIRKLRCTTVSKSTLGSITTVYAYSARCKTFITDSGKKINIEIATSGNDVTIGWPVILGSY